MSSHFLLLEFIAPMFLVFLQLAHVMQDTTMKSENLYIRHSNEVT